MAAGRQQLVGSPTMTRTLLASCAVLLCLVVAGKAGIPDRGYVVVQDGAFWLNCRPFFFAGCNAWDLVTNASDPHTAWTVNATFNAMGAANLSVIRTWTYSQIPGQPLLISPGYYNETIFRGLDFVLEQARQRGIRAILSLLGYWNPVDGVPKIVRWAGLNNTDDFFTNWRCKELYRNHVSAILGRVNHFNGRTYKDDPTIMAWNLLSEPRCFGGGCMHAVQNWVEEMSAQVKFLDTNHLVTTGFEGFYSYSSWDRISYNPGEPSGNWAALTGQDFLMNHAPWSIDFAVAHLWLENWISQQTPQEKIAFVQNWTMIHQQDAQYRLKKPLVWEEFGESNEYWNGQSAQQEVYTTMFPIILNSLLNGGAVQGTNFWVFNSPDGEYNYTVTEGSSTWELLSSYSDQIVAHQESYGDGC